MNRGRPPPSASGWVRLRVPLVRGETAMTKKVDWYYHRNG